MNETYERSLYMNEDWKRKLCSRKFWAAVVTFVTALLAVFGVPDITVTQISGVITAASVMIAYIVGEGFVDAARIKTQSEKSEQKE